MEPEALRFDGDVVAITGAGRGMGREYALLLARRGARVIVNDIDADRARDAVATVEEVNGTALVDTSDVSDPVQTDALVAAAVAKWGRIDAIINNAATYGGALPDPEVTGRTLDVHLVATINLVRSAMPVFRQRQYGRILNIGSGSMFGLPGDAIYAAGKGGVFGFTKALAANLAQDESCDIRANVMLPAAFRDGMINVTDPELNDIIQNVFALANVAPLAMLLVHSACPSSGEAIQVGGGRHARVILATTEGWQAPGAETTPEAILEHWDEVVANHDPRETVGTLADLMARRGYPDYSVAELLDWTKTGKNPRELTGQSGTDCDA